jgi:hypothetical protein
MGRYIVGQNVDFEHKYWFAEQPSELGIVLERIVPESISRFVGDDGEYVHVENTEEVRRKIKKAISKAQVYTTENVGATKDMLKAILKCLEENDDVEIVEFYGEY